MNRFFRRILATIIAFGCELGLILMLRVGPPVYKIFVVAVMVVVLWVYLNYLKTDRRKRKSKKDEK